MLSYEPEILLLCIYPRQAKACFHENLNMNDHRTIIHNSQNVGAQMPINRKTTKPESIYPLHCKRNEALIHTTKWTNIQNYKLNERN